MGAVPLQGYAEIGWCVLGFKSSENTRIPDGIWVRGVDYLEGQLETLATLVSSNFHPDLVWWDNAIMPSKPLDAGIG